MPSFFVYIDNNYLKTLLFAYMKNSGHHANIPFQLLVIPRHKIHNISPWNGKINYRTLFISPVRAKRGADLTEAPL
jgi:hypothetical protein